MKKLLGRLAKSKSATEVAQDQNNDDQLIAPDTAAQTVVA